MDVETMHIAVKQHLDKTTALDLAAYEPEEIDFWLNEAIRKFVKTRYSGFNIKRESFEETQKRTDDLRTLITSDALDLIADVTDYPNAYKIDTGGGKTWPTDYWFTISEEVTGTIATVSTRMGVTQCSHDEYRQKIDDPFSEHVLHYNNAKPLRFFDVDSVKLITDGNYTLETFHLTYLTQPTEVDSTVTPSSNNVNCNLPTHTHDEVAKMAADMMLENIEQPRYQTHMNEVNTME